MAKSSPSPAGSTRLLLVSRRRSMPGQARRKSSSRGSSQPVAKVPTTPTVSTSLKRPPEKRASVAPIRSKRILHHRDQRQPLVGERQSARQAAEERHTQPILQRLHLMADRALADAQLLPCSREAQMAGGGVEGAECIQGELGPVHGGKLWIQFMASSRYDALSGMRLSRHPPPASREELMDRRGFLWTAGLAAVASAAAGGPKKNSGLAGRGVRPCRAGLRAAQRRAAGHRGARHGDGRGLRMERGRALPHVQHLQAGACRRHAPARRTGAGKGWSDACPSDSGT